MRIRYLKEGFKQIDKLKDTIDKRLTADDIRNDTRKILLEKVSFIRRELYRCLYEKLYSGSKRNEDLAFVDYGTYLNDDPLEITYRVPGLMDELYNDIFDMNVDSWTEKYVKTFNVSDLNFKDCSVFGKLCDPIKNIDFQGNSFIATIRLVLLHPHWNVNLFPGKFIKVFSEIEKEVSKTTEANIKIKLVILKDEAKNFVDYHMFARDHFNNEIEEVGFPGADIYDIGLYNFDIESFKDLGDFINRFDSFDNSITHGRLSLVNTYMDSLDNVPDLHIKFNFIGIETLKGTSITSRVGKAGLPTRKVMYELGDYTKFLVNDTSSHQRKSSIIIFPDALNPSVVEMISNGVITKEQYMKKEESNAPVAFNPYKGINTTP